MLSGVNRLLKNVINAEFVRWFGIYGNHAKNRFFFEKHNPCSRPACSNRLLYCTAGMDMNRVTQECLDVQRKGSFNLASRSEKVW